MTRAKIEIWLMAAATVAALAASLAWLLVPAYTSTHTHDGSTHSHETEELSLVEHEGAWVVPLLAIPVLVAAAPLVVRRPNVTRIAAALMFAFALVTGFTVGLYYWPAVALLVGAAVASGYRSERSPAPART
jgi:hypothetical protein